jgi:hypothetical protein
MTRHPAPRFLARSIGIVTTLVLVAACSLGGGGSPTPKPQPSTGCEPTPAPTLAPTPNGCGGGGQLLTAAELRLFLIDHFGPRWYCDPDEYPVSRGSERERAIERYPEMVAEHELFSTIADRLGIDSDANHTDAEKLAIYQMWKVAVSVPLDQVGDGRYRFDYQAQPVGGAAQGLRTAGIVDDHGAITIEQQAAAGEPNCPICLARGTPIDTPDGPIAVERLRLGDPIWTLDRNGNRVLGTVIALGSTTAPESHHVVRLVLEDGRTVTASPGHPLADGRLIGDVRVGEVVDGSSVAGMTTLSYGGDETFDLVASGETGFYFAGGIAVGSTLIAR